MMLKNRSDRWGGVSQLLHWLVAALILTMAYLGLTMGDLPNGPDKIRTYALHKSIGITILALVAMRLVWRFYAGAPLPVPGTPRWQEGIASFTHWAIYGLLFAIPVSGWVLSSVPSFPLRWFSLFDIPKIPGVDQEMHESAGDAHEIMFWLLALLVAAHAGAAFYHHLFLRDSTLARMLPKGWLRTGDPTNVNPISQDSDHVA